MEKKSGREPQMTMGSRYTSGLAPSQSTLTGAEAEDEREALLAQEKAASTKDATSHTSSSSSSSSSSTTKRSIPNGGGGGGGGGGDASSVARGSSTKYVRGSGGYRPRYYRARVPPPPKTTLAAVLMLVGGLLLSFMGAVVWLNDEEKGRERGLSLVILACLLILPGSYASINLLGAYLGWSGWHYSAIPSYDD